MLGYTDLLDISMEIRDNETKLLAWPNVSMAHQMIVLFCPWYKRAEHF
jgi:hypothetical protein